VVATCPVRKARPVPKFMGHVLWPLAGFGIFVLVWYAVAL
jgi:hypothetical protein